MILIVGGRGSMGRRYQAILKYLGKSFVAVDQETTSNEMKTYALRSDGVILATPTDLHVSQIRELLPLKKPILCEKPITKNLEELRTLFGEIEKSHTPFRMMFQYSVLSAPNRIGKTRYDYFRTGNDGLIWDCMQIIGLARGEVELKNESPVWSCILNGKTLNFTSMDAAYVAYVQRWFLNPEQDLKNLLTLHEKTHEMSLRFRETRAMH
jgi:hypothetical protein